MTFEKDGAEIEVPTMRLRELNKSNASRCVHVDRRCSGSAVHPFACDLLPLATDCRSIDEMVSVVNGQEKAQSRSLNAAPGSAIRRSVMLHTWCLAAYVPGTSSVNVPVAYGCCSI